MIEGNDNERKAKQATATGRVSDDVVINRAPMGATLNIG
jgi:hypothetical protein